MSNPENHQPEPPEVTNKRLGAVGAEDTAPERRVCLVLGRMGYEYETHREDLPGTPDIVLEDLETVILVHGCFWHHHEGCSDAKIPNKNEEYWKDKFKRNKERDRENKDELEEEGWNVEVIWECETKDVSELKRSLKNIS